MQRADKPQHKLPVCTPHHNMATAMSMEMTDMSKVYPIRVSSSQPLPVAVAEVMPPVTPENACVDGDTAVPDDSLKQRLLWLLCDDGPFKSLSKQSEMDMRSCRPVVTFTAQPLESARPDTNAPEHVIITHKVTLHPTSRGEKTPVSGKLKTFVRVGQFHRMHLTRSYQRTLSKAFVFATASSVQS